MVITVYMYILRASWKISYYMYTRIYVCAKCCHPHKIKSLLTTYLLTYLLTRTGIKSGMSLNFGQFGPLSTELGALECPKNFPKSYNGKMVSPS